MQCATCGHQNRATARFCEACGAQLAPVCPQCGAEARPGARFCDACGQRLPDASDAPMGTAVGSAPATSATPATAATTVSSGGRAYPPPHLAAKLVRDRAPLEGERRTVTVLFVDTVDSTPLGERLDPEAVYALTQGGLARMIETVHRYEGSVSHFLGDGLMALFGAPIAHEDAARRAVAAGLLMQQALGDYAREVEQQHGVALRYRVGLHTGPVVVGRIGDDLAMDYSAVGDTANLGARLEQLAAPGTVCLSEQTYLAVRDYVECEPLGPQPVKGKAGTVVAYRAFREKPGRTRIEVAAEHGLTAFVGREHELAVLQGYFHRARDGAGQVVFVSGEAGIGKSRLLLEFRHTLDTLGDAVAQWLEGRCISLGGNIPYLPIAELVRRTFGVIEADTPEDIIRRVDEGLGHWDEAARVAAPYLKFLLTVDPGKAIVATMDPQERRAGLFDALRALLLQESRHGPVVVVVEDLHWIDEQSEAALAALVDAIATAPVLLLLTYRPGYAPSLGERTYYSRLALSHLPPAESAALAGAVLQATTLPPPLRDLVTTKGGGNPFFIEEVVKALVESGAVRRSNGTYTLERPLAQVHIPDTIQEVILSRIDRLDRPAKEAIQLASVVGREFTLRLLERIAAAEARLTTVEAALGELKALELIYQKSYFPELAYMFKHALTHEVAQSTLLQERRKALHRLVGAAIEELYTDRLPEHYEMLAEHYIAGETWDKALTYLIKAGDKAAAAYANQDALDYYARAVAVAERLGGASLGTAAAIAERRGWLDFTTGRIPAAIADSERMVAIARKLGDRRLEGQGLALQGFFEVWHHEFDMGQRTLEEAFAIASEGHDEVRLAATAYRLFLALAVGRLDEMVLLGGEMERLMARGVRANPFAEGMWLYVRTGLANWEGRFEDELDELVAARKLAEEQGHEQARFMFGFHEMLTYVGKGDYGAALSLLGDVIATCERIGEKVWLARYFNVVGWVYGELQDFEQAMDWNHRSLATALEVNAPDPEIENNARLNLGDDLLALGDLAAAEEQFRTVERVVRNPRPAELWALWAYSQHLFHSYGELWLAKGDPDKALAYAAECLERAQATGRRKNMVKARRLRGQALLMQGKTTPAQEELTTALEVAKQIGNPPQLWKTWAALGDLRRAQGEAEQARRAYGQALLVIDGVANGLTDEHLRRTFLASSEVQRIRDALGETEARGQAVLVDSKR